MYSTFFLSHTHIVWHPFLMKLFGISQGYGIYFYNDTAVYEGEWSEGQRSGRGKMFHENGDVYEGEWMNDKNHGEGKLLFGKNVYLQFILFIVKNKYSTTLVLQQMEAGMRAPGKTARGMATGNLTILKKACFM